MLRPVTLSHYLKTLALLGVAEDDVLANTGIDPIAAEDPGYLVSLEQYCGLFENMARLAPEGAGLEIGLRSELAQFGVLGHAVNACDSARGSVEELWIRFGGRLGMLAIPRIGEVLGTAVRVEFSLPVMSDAAYRFCIEETLCRVAKMGELVSGERVVFGQVFLTYSEPPYASRYEEIFRCPVRFRAPYSGALMDRKWFEKPLASRDEALKEFYLRHLWHLERRIRGRSSVLDQAREILMRSPVGRLPSQTELARSLDVSIRSLCRALEDEGTSYRELLEEMRMHAVSVKLFSTRSSAKELAFLAGYRDVNAFRRAFRKWTGRTVGEYRSGCS